MRRIPWTQVGTAIGVLAAIGSLLFTAIATYYGAKVSEDELQQSREEASDGARAQAVRVSFWYNPGFTYPDDPEEVHLMNRSADPVQKVILKFEVTKEYVVGKEPKWPILLLYLPSIPPCSELTLKRDSIRYQPVSEYSWRKLKPGEYLNLESLIFTDRDHVRWLRDEAGKLSLRRKQVKYPLTGRVAGVTPIAPAKECSDA
ncbi:hypothetical protein [Streptomyces sp. NPDC001083]|uniref:hypothetical protein n=1 Tax=Streptomyces sp. NPDC001083 TaxID=3364545 RepID=UPI003682CE30